MIDFLYHPTIYYDIHQYNQELEPDMLKYELVLEKVKSHERNCLEYKDHQASYRGANNPLMSTHVIQRHRPSSYGKGCHQCSKSHEWGNCPAYGNICGKYRGFNHFKAICHSKGTAKAPTRRSLSNREIDDHPWGLTVEAVASSSSGRNVKELQRRSHNTTSREHLV